MPSETPLDVLQRWMQAVIVHPGEIEAALSSSQAAALVDPEALREVVLPSATLTPAERVEIYHGMYLLRMEEALASDYPALKHFLGDDAFLDLAREYVLAHPSTSYSLNPFGAQLPDFLETASVPRRDFCVDLARLERAIEEAFDAEETPALTAAEIAAVSEAGWERAILRPVAAFQLLSLRYPVSAYLQSVKDDDHNHPNPRLKRTYVAVYRRDYSVYRLDLSREAHDLLGDLVSGVPLGEAILKAQKARRRGPKEEEVFRWFRNWVSGGIFRSVSVSA